MTFVVFVIIAILWMAIVGYFTGSKDYFMGSNDDERKRSIKQKSVVQSWSTVLLFLLTNFLYDYFNLFDERLADVPFVYPELLYLIILVVSYFIFFIINNRKMSAN